MSSERKISTCLNCDEEREIAAHGLCFKCYRAAERAAENPWAAADRHNRAKLRTQKKLRKVVTSILNAVDDGIELLANDDVSAIRSVLKPYLYRMAAGLPEPEKSVGTVNSERNDAVDCSLVENGLGVNSEPEANVNCSLRKLADDVNIEHQSGVLSSDVDDTGIVNSEHETAVNCSPEATTAELIRPEPEATENSSKPEPAPLIKGQSYGVRPHPMGGFGVYGGGSPICLQRHADEFDAWKEVIAVTDIPEEGMRELLEGI